MTNSESSVRVGMIGTSWWADAMHMPALASHPEASVLAVCGRNRANAQRLADSWDVPNVFTDYGEMIDSGLVDAVVISTPNDLHYPISMRALEAKLHVLCEKPLALDYAAAQKMATYAKENDLITMTPFTYRFMPTARYMKELIDDDYIGRPYHLNMRYYTGYARDGAYHWRFDKARAGAGVVGDLGAHFIYLAMWMFGDIHSVSCQLGHVVPRADSTPDGQTYTVADDVAIITLNFSNGAHGVIHVTAVCYEDTPFGQTHHMEFHGSGGTLYSFTDWDTIQQVSGAKVGEGAVKPLEIPDHIWGQARRDSVHNTYRDLFRREDFMIRHFISGIVDNTAVSPDFNDGAAVQRILDAAVQSHETGQRFLVSSIR